MQTVKREPENTKEYLEALMELDREFKEAPALTKFQALLLETNFGVLCDQAWDGGPL